MMHHTILRSITIFTILSFSQLLFAQDKPVLDSLRIWTISIDSDTTDKRKNFYKYNGKGLEIESISQEPSSDGFKNERRITKTYNDDNLVTSNEWFEYNSDGSQKITSKRISEYDGQFRTYYIQFQRSGDTITPWRRENTIEEGDNFKKYFDDFDSDENVWDTTRYSIYDDQYRLLQAYSAFSFMTFPELLIKTYPDQTTFLSNADTLYQIESIGFQNLIRVREMSYTSIGRIQSRITFVPNDSEGFDTSSIVTWQYLESNPEILIKSTTIEIENGVRQITSFTERQYNEDERLIYFESFRLDEDILKSSSRSTYDITPDSTVYEFYFNDELWNRDIRIENEYKQPIKEWGYSFVFNSAMDHEYTEAYYNFPGEVTSNRLINENLDIILFPNPTPDMIYLDGSDASKVQVFSIHGLNGQLISHGTFNGRNIDLPNSDNGMLVVSLQNHQGKIIATKLIMKE